MLDKPRDTFSSFRFAQELYDAMYGDEFDQCEFLEEHGLDGEGGSPAEFLHNVLRGMLEEVGDAKP